MGRMWQWEPSPSPTLSSQGVDYGEIELESGSLGSSPIQLPGNTINAPKIPSLNLLM